MMRIVYHTILMMYFMANMVNGHSQLGALYYNGAISSGLQGYTNHQGSEAIFMNPAGLAQSTTHYGAVLNYTDQYGLGELNKIAIGGRLKTNSSHFAIGIYQYGIDDYHEQSFTLSYARSLLANLQFGIQFNHNRLTIEDLSTVSQNAVNIGFQSKINKTIMASGMIANAFKIQSENYASPRQIQFGITYIPAANASILFEAIKQAERPLTGVIAVSYLPSDKVNLRLGADMTRAEIGFSLFYNMGKAHVGVGYNTHQYLGGSYSLSGVID
jgi:hypothetical protein